MLLYGCIDIISWKCWIYLLNDGLTPFVDVTIVLVWRGVSWSGCRVVWRVVSLCWLERIVVWVHCFSAHRSISSSVVALVCRMTPSSSFITFPLLHVFNNCMVCSEYSCLLLRMCNAYTEIGLFVLTYMFTVSYFSWSSSLANIWFVQCFAS